MSNNQIPDPYAPPGSNGGVTPESNVPQYGQRSGEWTPNSSGSSPQNGQPDSPWPVYGQQQPAYPQAQQNPWQQQGSASPFPTQGSTPLGTPPSRLGAILTLIAGIVTMVLIAPIVFVTTLLGGIGIDQMIDEGFQTGNGQEVVVDSSGTLAVTPLSGSASSCQLVTAGGEAIPMYFESDSGGMYIARGVQAGVYTVECEGLQPGAALMVMDGEFLSNVVGSSMAALGWATLVGFIGLAMLITGIVWLVRRNGARRAYYQGRPY